MHSILPILRSVLLTLSLATVAASPAMAQPTPAAAAEGRIDLNTASVEQLTSLPGIGTSKAEAIVAFRERRPFRRIEELMRVRGIGRATFRRLRDRLEVNR